MAGMELISIPAECYTWVKGDEAMHNTCDAQAGNCSTLVFGKAASETGHVMIAHNEDDSNCVVQMLRVPRKRHNAAEVLRFPDGSAEIPQVSETNAYYWSEIRAPHGASFGDSFINEHGVAVFSNRAMPCKLPRVSEKTGSDMVCGRLSQNVQHQPEMVCVFLRIWLKHTVISVQGYT